MKNKKAIDYINKEYLDWCGDLTKEEIEYLWDYPSLEKIEEVVWIDRFNEDWLDTCKEIQSKFKA